MKRLIVLILILGVSACQKSGPSPKPDNGNGTKEEPDKPEPDKPEPVKKTTDPAVHKKRVDATRSKFGRVSHALRLFKFDHDRLPEKLGDLVEAPSYVDASKWSEDGYLSKASDLKDAWGNDLVYTVEGRRYKLGSYGEDGAEGGEGFNADFWK